VPYNSYPYHHHPFKKGLAHDMNPVVFMAQFWTYQKMCFIYIFIYLYTVFYEVVEHPVRETGRFSRVTSWSKEKSRKKVTPWTKAAFQLSFSVLLHLLFTFRIVCSPGVTPFEQGILFLLFLFTRTLSHCLPARVQKLRVNQPLLATLQTK
jgi:hypothetical protein